MPWAAGRPPRTKKFPIWELEHLEDRSLLSSGKAFPQIAPIAQTDGTTLVLAPEHDSSSLRGVDARDGVSSPTDFRSTVTARAPVLSDQGEEESLGDHHHLSGALSKRRVPVPRAWRRATAPHASPFDSVQGGAILMSKTMATE